MLKIRELCSMRRPRPWPRSETRLAFHGSSRSATPTSMASSSACPMPGTLFRTWLTKPVHGHACEAIEQLTEASDGENCLLVHFRRLFGKQPPHRQRRQIQRFGEFAVQRFEYGVRAFFELSCPRPIARRMKKPLSKSPSAIRCGTAYGKFRSAGLRTSRPRLGGIADVIQGEQDRRCSLAPTRPERCGGESGHKPCCSGRGLALHVFSVANP